jgi:hypothetical protein
MSSLDVGDQEVALRFGLGSQSTKCFSLQQISWWRILLGTELLSVIEEMHYLFRLSVDGLM